MRPIGLAIPMHANAGPRQARTRRGFTLIELVIVMIMIGTMTAMVLPKLRISPETEVQLAGMQLAQDIDLARTRALSTRGSVRVTFVEDSRTYTGFLDTDADGLFGETIAERDALRGFATRTLPTRVNFGRGSVSAIAGDASSSAITFASAKINIDSRGLPAPMGTSGVVYLRHATSASAVAAVAVSPAGSVRLWTWHNGAWQ